MKKQIAIIGSGNMGTAMAQVFSGNGHAVRIWSNEEKILKEIAARRTNRQYLPGVNLNQNIFAKPSYVECIKDANLIVLAIPSDEMPGVVKKIIPVLTPKMKILSVVKGLSKKTLRTTTEETLRSLPKYLKNNFVKMTGPAIAAEFVHRMPTAVELASPNRASSLAVKKLLENEYFRVKITDDIVGASMCASLKNVYAILLGIADGYGWRLNTKSVILSIALNEMELILKKLHADPKTALSLSGIGDLIATALNPKSRNVNYGRMIAAKRVAPPKALGMTQTVEGYRAAPLFARLMKKKKISAPLIFLCSDILKKKKPPKRALENFIKNI